MDSFRLVYFFIGSTGGGLGGGTGWSAVRRGREIVRLSEPLRR